MKYWNEFRGIKYGRKPIRFEKPIPKATNNNPQDATKYGSQCVQERFKVLTRKNGLIHGTYNPFTWIVNQNKRRTVGYESPYYVGDEDCLYLNVMKRENPSNTNLLPVFIWIHGGSSKHGNNTGDVWSEDSHQYDGRFLALQENIVFVSINYRVNSFGFLIWKGNKGTVIYQLIQTIYGFDQGIPFKHINDQNKAHQHGIQTSMVIKNRINTRITTETWLFMMQSLHFNGSGK